MGEQTKTVQIEMSETVFYEFSIEVPIDADESEIEAAAEEYFTNDGPKTNWFTHCTDRQVVEYEELE